MNIYCFNCETQVSDKATSCPKCGHPLAAETTPLVVVSGKTKWIIASIVISVSLSSLVWYSQRQPIAIAEPVFSETKPTSLSVFYIPLRGEFSSLESFVSWVGVADNITEHKYVPSYLSHDVSAVTCFQTISKMAASMSPHTTDEHGSRISLDKFFLNIKGVSMFHVANSQAGDMYWKFNAYSCGSNYLVADRTSRLDKIFFSAFIDEIQNAASQTGSDVSGELWEAMAAAVTLLSEDWLAHHNEDLSKICFQMYQVEYEDNENFLITVNAHDEDYCEDDIFEPSSTMNVHFTLRP